jgi:hypothetical protein
VSNRKKKSLTDEDQIQIRMKLHAVPPPCFSGEQWRTWRHGGSGGSYGALPSPRDGYCEDCTPEYKTEMMLQEKCIWPCVTFALDKDGMLAGTRESMKKVSPAQLTWLLRRETRG